MPTNEMSKVLKSTDLPPGTPKGPLNLPVSYYKEQYATSRNNFGAPGVPKSRRNDLHRKRDSGKDWIWN